MRNGKIGYYDDIFGLDVSYMNYGGYADPAQSIALPGMSPESPPVALVPKSYGYFFPALQVTHHYDVNYFDSDYWQNGQLSGGNYNYSNFSIDTVDLYSFLGHTSMYHISSASGYGSWSTAPGYYSSWSHFDQSEAAGVHTDSWFGSSDAFAFRTISGNNSHLELGSLVIDNSHTEIHEGAGVHVATILESLDGFAFRDTVIDTAHVQIGNYTYDAMHSEVHGGSQMTVADLFGGNGHGQSSFIQVHDQWSQSGNGHFESHTSDYASHTTDTVTSGIEPYMVSGLQIDDISLLLGIGGGKG